MGFSFITGDQTIVHADNASFDGTERAGALAADGQLWIGATALPHVRKNTLTAGTGITITNGPGTISIGVTASSPLSFTEDSGTATPTSNNLNVFGQKAGTVPVVFTTGSGATVSVEDRTWPTAFVVDPSSTVGLRGTFTTIAAALTAAVSGQTIFIRPGTYTENLTLKAGVDLCSFQGEAEEGQVTIIGTLTATFTGLCTVSGIRLQTNSANVLVVSGSNATFVDLFNCFINVTNNTAIVVSSSGGSKLRLYECNGTITSTGITYFACTNGTLVLQYCKLNNDAASTTASTFSSTASLGANYCTISTNISSSNTASIGASFCTIGNSSGVAALLMSGTSTAVILGCYLASGTASAISIGAGCLAQVVNCIISSSNTNAITGAGSIQYSGISFSLTSSLMNTTTQTPFAQSNDAVVVKSPGAYPYTTVPQDALILVDTSSARTIVPLASPTTGQVHRIKDSVGSAAANNITITPSGKNIDGAASKVINTNYGSVDIIFNGTEWSVL